MKTRAGRRVGTVQEVPLTHQLVFITVSMWAVNTAAQMPGCERLSGGGLCA